jgi:hypothetical protein
MDKERLKNSALSGASGFIVSLLFTLSITGINYLKDFLLWIFIISIISILLGLAIKFEKSYTPVFTGGGAALVCCISILFYATSNI